MGASWKGSTPEATVEVDELLVVQGWKRMPTSSVMIAYNFTTKEKKELPENCAGIAIIIDETLILINFALPYREVFYKAFQDKTVSLRTNRACERTITLHS